MCSVKKVFLEISQNTQENTCARVSFLTKLQACNFIKKETLAQVFSCEFCEIPKNTFSHRTPPVAASVLYIYKVVLGAVGGNHSLRTDDEVSQKKILISFSM